MKAKILVTGLFAIIILNVSTCKDEDDDCYGCDVPKFQLYKLRCDYTKNVCVAMNKDKSRIVGTPSPDSPAGDTACHPITLINGYYLDYNCNYGVNSAYLTITREEFITWVYEIPVDSYKYYLLDADPYLEYYVTSYKVPNDSCSLDTLCLNNLIRNNDIEKYFERLK